MTDTYDLVAIGAGPAGESATELAAFFGHRSAVIEKAQPGARYHAVAEPGSTVGSVPITRDARFSSVIPLETPEARSP